MPNSLYAATALREIVSTPRVFPGPYGAPVGEIDRSEKCEPPLQKGRTRNLIQEIGSRQTCRRILDHDKPGCEDGLDSKII
jgi:hypothetical protein